MYMKQITYNVIVIVLMLLPVIGKSQGSPQFSHNRFNLLKFNPGFAGQKENICTGLIHRDQWRGFEGGIRTTVVNAHAPFQLFGKSHGVGVSIMQDNFAFNSDFVANLAYSYKIQTDNGTFGLGINAGVTYVTMDVENGWQAETSASSDPYIPAASGKSVPGFDAGIGLFYSNDNLYAGISGLHLYNSYKIQSQDQVVKPLQLNKAINLVAGYTVPLNNPDFKMQHGFMINYDLSPFSDITENKSQISQLIQINLSETLIYKETIWGGLSYRYGDAIIGRVGAKLFKDVKIGVAYDFGTSVINDYNNFHGSFELLVHYCFDLKVDKKTKGYKSIRFL